MSENTVYSLAGTLRHTDGLTHRLQEMRASLLETMEQEYLLKIRSAAAAEKALALEHPPREVTLLRAISAFLDDGGKAQVQQMTRSLLFLHSMRHIQAGIAEIGEGTLLAARSASAEGAEGEDPTRFAQLAGLLLALSLADQF